MYEPAVVPAPPLGATVTLLVLAPHAPSNNKPPIASAAFLFFTEINSIPPINRTIATGSKLLAFVVLIVSTPFCVIAQDDMGAGSEHWYATVPEKPLIGVTAI
jgi:hypothetical protein